MVSEFFRRALCATSPEPIGLVVERAEGVWITTTDGRRYLDWTAGIGVANVGHGRREIAEAVARQLDRHAHVMVYGEYEQAVQTAFAAALTARFPDPLSQVFLTSSGTEAVEGALKIARKHTGRARFVAFERSYHGDTMGALSVQGSARYRAPFEPLVAPVTFLPFGEIDALKAIDESVAAVIVEPVQGEGGIRVPPAGFLETLHERCRAAGAVLVYDEVMTGFGRTGREFALQHGTVVPDLVCLAKAMGGGLPLGGIVGSPEILRTVSIDPPLNHVTTFGGNPVSCAAGLAALEILIEEDLSNRAARVGEFLRRGLEGFVERGGVAEVRGIGLMLGLRFETGERARRFVRGCLERELLLGWTLHGDDVVRITPPLVLSMDGAAEGLSRTADALRAS